jgi:1-aminocyclopropane-1-carboxylate deaminase/D-cysteine desulfhydrase-like pyridoxal-dependent ACC family enzyme
VANLARFPRLRYTPFATPLHPLPRFTAALNGGKPAVHLYEDVLLGRQPL